MAEVAKPKPPPPNPTGTLEQNRREMQAKQAFSQAKLSADVQRAQADAAEMFAKHKMESENDTAAVIKLLHDEAAKQASYAGQSAPTGAGPKPPPVPMLPTVNVNPSQPMSGAPKPTDMAAQFGQVVDGAGADPNLAAGGGGARQVLNAAQGGQQGPGGIPMIPIPGMDAPTPGAPQMGNPSVTLDNGQTFTSPSMVPTNTIQNKSGFTTEGGQRMPVNESTITSEMKPNVLTPGDILQAKQNQQMLQWRKQVDQITLSMDAAKMRQSTHIELSKIMPAAAAVKVGELISTGDFEGAQRYLTDNKVPTSFTNEQALINVQMINARAQAGAAGQLMRLHAAQTEGEWQKQRLENEQQTMRRYNFESAMAQRMGVAPPPPPTFTGPGGIEPPNPKAVSPRTILSSQVFGGRVLPEFTTNANGDFIPNPGAYLDQNNKLMAALGNVRNLSNTEIGAGGFGTQLAALVEIGLPVGKLPVYSSAGRELGLGGADPGGLLGGSVGNGVDVMDANVLVQLGLIALGSSDALLDVKPEAQQYARDLLVDMKMVQINPKTHQMEAITTGEWISPSQRFMLGLQTAHNGHWGVNGLHIDAYEGKLHPLVQQALAIQAGEGDGGGGGKSSLGASHPVQTDAEFAAANPAPPNPTDLYIDVDLRWARSHLPPDHPIRVGIEQRKAEIVAARGPTVQEQVARVPGQVAQAVQDEFAYRPRSRQLPASKPARVPSQAERLASYGSRGRSTAPMSAEEAYRSTQGGSAD